MAGAMVGIQTYPAYSCAASDAACGQPWLGDKGIVDQFIAIVFYIEVRCCCYELLYASG